MSNTKERIIKVAEELLLTKGVAGCSLGNIGLALTMSKGTLYYHYKSKDDLLDAVALNHGKRFTTKFEKLMEERDNMPLESHEIETLLEELLDSNDGKIHLVLAIEALTGNERLRAEILVKYREWSELIGRSCCQDIKVEGISKEEYGEIILSMIIGLVLRKNLLGVDKPFTSLSAISKYIS